jgi:hypothetical protein
MTIWRPEFALTSNPRRWEIVPTAVHSRGTIYFSCSKSFPLDSPRNLLNGWVSSLATEKFMILTLPLHVTHISKLQPPFNEGLKKKPNIYENYGIS